MDRDYFRDGYILAPMNECIKDIKSYIIYSFIRDMHAYYSVDLVSLKSQDVDE